jgi:hypothetical protein
LPQAKLGATNVIVFMPQTTKESIREFDWQCFEEGPSYWRSPGPQQRVILSDFQKPQKPKKKSHIQKSRAG